MLALDRSLRFAALLLVASALACNDSHKASPTTPPAVELDGFIFNEAYTCSQAFGSDAPFCADNQATGQIQFTKTGSGTYQVRDVPDSGFIYNGTLSGLTFTWTAVSPNGYTESGTWTFAADGQSFAGTSHYVADDQAYTGDCNATGARAPATPPAPGPIGACP